MSGLGSVNFVIFDILPDSRFEYRLIVLFEGMLANRMVIADRPDKNTQIEQIFVEGKDIVYFDSLDDLIEKINYYTVNEDKRLEIAYAGFNKVSKYHTATARVRSLLKHL